jgi:hypothetical protein
VWWWQSSSSGDQVAGVMARVAMAVADKWGWWWSGGRESGGNCGG